jgi:hypothetical protein
LLPATDRKKKENKEDQGKRKKEEVQENFSRQKQILKFGEILRVLARIGLWWS